MSKPIEPLLLTVADAVRISGFSRSEIYRRLADGRIHGKKMRTRTLVVFESLRAHINGLEDYQAKQ
jgi:hypothetical protein